MSFFDSNRLLWVVVAIGLGSAYYTVPALLRTVKDAARAPRPDSPPPARHLQKESENSLKIETLRALADGHSYDLRSSAIKIVAYRTIRTSTKDLLLRDIASKDYVRRDNAINALWMLLFHARLNTTCFADVFSGRRGIEAVVEALIQELPAHSVSLRNPPGGGPDGEHTNTMPPSPLKPNHRPAHEASLLIILNHLFNHTGRSFIQRKLGAMAPVDHAIMGGLVSRWLAKYPFPCSLPENEKFGFNHSDVARLCERSVWGTDDPLMADIVKAVMASAAGQVAMLDAGLRAGNYSPNSGSGDGWNLNSRWQVSTYDTYGNGLGGGGDDDGGDDRNDDDEDHDVVMTDGEDTAGVRLEHDQAEWMPLLPRPRSAERTQEEEHLRRRHREAIVVAERGTPLRRENILQRENSQFGLRPMGDMTEAERVFDSLMNLSDSDDADHDVDGRVAEPQDLSSAAGEHVAPMELPVVIEHTSDHGRELTPTDHGNEHNST